MCSSGSQGSGIVCSLIRGYVAHRKEVSYHATIWLLCLEAGPSDIPQNVVELIHHNRVPSHKDGNKLSYKMPQKSETSTHSVHLSRHLIVG